MQNNNYGKFHESDAFLFRKRCLHFLCLFGEGKGIVEKWWYILKFHERCNTRSRAARVFSWCFFSSSLELLWYPHTQNTRCVYVESFSHKFIKLLKEITGASLVHVCTPYTHCCFYLRSSDERKEASISSYCWAHILYNPPSLPLHRHMKSNSYIHLARQYFLAKSHTYRFRCWLNWWL